MKRILHARRRGFTLIELTVAMMMGMMTGAMVLALFNQQLAFLKVYKAQDFLIDEAPVISVYVSKLVGKADRFRLHATLDDAKAGKSPQLTPSPVIVLNYRQPDGSIRASILSFEAGQLYYYVVPTAGALGPPQWSVTSKAAKVEFVVNAGVLCMTLTGPAGEVITYSGTMQL